MKAGTVTTVVLQVAWRMLRWVGGDCSSQLGVLRGAVPVYYVVVPVCSSTLREPRRAVRGQAATRGWQLHTLAVLPRRPLHRHSRTVCGRVGAATS